MKRVIASAVLMICAGLLFADDPSEKGVPTSPLTIYSGGISAGAMIPLNNDLQDYSRSFMKLSFINQIYYREHIGIFWMLTGLLGKNFGADLGFDFPTSSDFRPFLGLGIEHIILIKHDEFGDNSAPQPRFIWDLYSMSPSHCR